MRGYTRAPISEHQRHAWRLVAAQSQLESYQLPRQDRRSWSNPGGVRSSWGRVPTLRGEKSAMARGPCRQLLASSPHAGSRRKFSVNGLGAVAPFNGAVPSTNWVDALALAVALTDILLWTVSRLGTIESSERVVAGISCGGRDFDTLQIIAPLRTSTMNRTTMPMSMGIPSALFCATRLMQALVRTEGELKCGSG
jgi:hypothetical protein